MCLYRCASNKITWPDEEHNLSDRAIAQNPDVQKSVPEPLVDRSRIFDSENENVASQDDGVHYQQYRNWQCALQKWMDVTEPEVEYQT
jgi:hypothetical protein